MDWGTIFQNAASAAVGGDAIVYALAAIGLNVHFGYTGLLNFGQAGFMAVAGYGMASTVATWGMSLWLGVLVGLGATAILALLLGAPTLRLRADYLAIVTIAAAEIIRLVVGSVTLKDYFGGRDGRQGFKNDFASINPFTTPVNIGPIYFSPYDAWVVLVGWVLVSLSCLIVWALMRSPWGRVLKSIREDEEPVRSLGKNVYAYKMQSLVIGGMFGALAGFMLALKQSSVVPDDFATDITFFAYTVLILGGAARVFGPVIGAVIFWLLISLLGGIFDYATAPAHRYIPTWLMTQDQASLVRFIVMGLALMLLMIYRPQGIFGDRRELAIDGR